MVVTDTMVRHAETWMRRNIPDEAHAVVTDVTSAYGQLNVQGPNSRALLQKLTSVDLSNAAFPFRAAREIDIGFARVLCIRITYLGELGYELYIPPNRPRTSMIASSRRGASSAWCTPASRRSQSAHGKRLPRLRPRHR